MRRFEKVKEVVFIRCFVGDNNMAIGDRIGGIGSTNGDDNNE